MKIEARWGDKPDALAEEMLNMAEEKMRMKNNIGKKRRR